MMTLIKMTNISLTLLKKTFFFLQQLMLLPCCSASLRIRTLITKSECPWSSHTLCSNMIQLHGRWWVQGDGQVLEFYIKKKHNLKQLDNTLEMSMYFWVTFYAEVLSDLHSLVTSLQAHNTVSMEGHYQDGKLTVAEQFTRNTFLNTTVVLRW